MICPRCNTPVDHGATFCGHCGNQLTPIQARGETIVEQASWARSEQQNQVHRVHDTPTRLARSVEPGWPPTIPHSTQAASGPGLSTPSFAARLPHLHGKQIAFLAIILVLLIGGISAGVSVLLAQRGAGPVAPTAVKGTASFNDSQDGHGLTNTITITIPGLQPPGAGMQYKAWLVSEQDESTLALGTLRQSGQSFVLNFSDPKNNLVGVGNKVIVTQEQGNVIAPIGKVLFSAQYPPLALIHIRHLLFSFPSTPGKIGLLVGLRDQARLLNSQATLLNSAVASGNVPAVLCAAQSTLNLIEGSQGAHTQPLAEACGQLNATVPNDGFGLLGRDDKSGYIALSAAHATLAATQKDATSTIKLHAQHVIIATNDVKGWVTTIDNDAQALLANPTDKTKAQEIVTLADHVLNGVDLNHDEHVDPVPGEAGSITAYVHGQLMAQLTLQP
ncbi:MAG: hypothetical protein J2P37_09380 [Ktedonobacteraceae bacterium]|nr:hypothetical protein [Ktedonobacteraceae bacterium]MBO0790590.1 hypothetical protein [Ktedonobacteraceae bacterium]